MWASVRAAAGHSLFPAIKPFLVSVSLHYQHDFQWEIRAGDSGKLRRVFGGNRYTNFILDTHCLKRKDVIHFPSVTGLLSAKTDHKVITEVVQNGNEFTWTQTIPNWTWSNRFSVGQECELVTMKGIKFKVGE